MLFDYVGNRKYLVRKEWRAFLRAADGADPQTRTFCHTLLRTGARLSEVRSLKARDFDIENLVVRIRCLKRRSPSVYREVPLDGKLFELLETEMFLTLRRADPSKIDALLWPWSRSTAWQRVRDIAVNASLPSHLCTPKALRHSFGIEGVLKQNIPLGTMQKWLGHARLESTVIYTTPVGHEERRLARRMWN